MNKDQTAALIAEAIKYKNRDIVGDVGYGVSLIRDLAAELERASARISELEVESRRFIQEKLQMHNIQVETAAHVLELQGIINRVRELHNPYEGFLDEPRCCNHDEEKYPCSTIRALDAQALKHVIRPKREVRGYVCSCGKQMLLGDNINGVLLAQVNTNGE